MRGKIQIKTEEELKIMAEGGQILAEVKDEVRKAVKVGAVAYDLDKLAEELLIKKGAEPSFNKVPGYYWTTCININSGIVHGIPTKKLIFKEGDVVSVDLGAYYKGFHTDTSFTYALNPTTSIKKFLAAGEEALHTAIKAAIPGNRIYDISKAIESTLTKYHYTPIRALVGHGVGRELHEEPQIPCFTAGRYTDSPEIVPGQALAIEVMYTEGNGEVVMEDDGWTIATYDDKISALYEESVAVHKNGTKVLTSLK
jgi:methionyl aminopeptidase